MDMNQLPQPRKRSQTERRRIALEQYNDGASSWEEYQEDLQRIASQPIEPDWTQEELRFNAKINEAFRKAGIPVIE